MFAAMLAYNNFVVYIVYISHDLIASLMHLSLSSTIFQFLLCLVQNFLVIYVTDLINGLVDLLSLETQAVQYAVQKGFEAIELWDKE